MNLIKEEAMDVFPSFGTDGNFECGSGMHFVIPLTSQRCCLPFLTTHDV